MMCLVVGGKGQKGLVCDLVAMGANSARSGVQVEWKDGSRSNYRLGFKGKVDLQYTEESPGGECYPRHLPAFGTKDFLKEKNLFDEFFHNYLINSELIHLTKSL